MFKKNNIYILIKKNCILFQNNVLYLFSKNFINLIYIKNSNLVFFFLNGNLKSIPKHVKKIKIIFYF